MKAARLWAADLSEDAEDLVQDALLKAMEGDRRCPAGVDVVTFLRGVIKSLKSAERKRRASAPAPLEHDPVARPPENAEASARTERRRQRLLALFPEGSYGRRIVEMKLDGLRGTEIRKRTGHSPTQHNSALRHIRRRVEKAKKDGTL